MKSFRRLTLSEYRMSHLTAMKVAEKLDGTGRILDEVHMKILGPEIMRELQ